MVQQVSKPSQKNNAPPLKVGITGGIGAGKSLVARIFRVLGVPVFYSDIEAKMCMITHDNVRNQIIQVFGSESYAGGKPNNAFLAEKIFSSDDLRNKLNGIIHPAVANVFEHWLGMHQGYAYVLNEAAITFETGLYKKLDFNILVTAPREIRVERVMNRDRIPVEMVEKRMATQWTDEQKIPLSNFVINNDGKNLIIPQILAVHKTLSEASLKKSN